MPLVTEQFNGGLVTNRDATLLAPGELQQADDCTYRPFDPAIHRAPGRTTYNATALGAVAVKGLAYLSFDQNDDVLLAYAGTSLYYSPYTGTTGTFYAIPTASTMPNATTDILNVIKYGDAYLTLHNAGGLSGRPRRIAYGAPFQSSTANCVLGATAVVTTSGTGNNFNTVTPGQIVTKASGTGSLADNTTVLSVDSATQITLSTPPLTTGTATLGFSGTPTVMSRFAGLDPVNAFGENNAAAASIIAGTATGVAQTSGSWSATLGNNYYYFLITEAYIPTYIDDVANGYCESGFTGVTQLVQISDYTTQAVTITFPAAVNNGTNNRNAATHFIVYMSTGQASPLPKPSLADFKRVGSEVPIVSLTAMQTLVLKDALLTQGFSGASRTASVGSWSMWDNASNLTSNGGMPDNAFASTTANDGLVAIGDYNFSITGSYASAAVTGIEVEVTATSDPSGSAGNASAVYVQLHHRTDATKTSDARRITIGSTVHAYTLGGALDKWGVDWLYSDMQNSQFEVYLYKVGSASTQRPAVDSVRVRVHYTGTSINNDGVPFAVVTYVSQVGTSVSDTANLPPVAASTGDVFQGQVVTNDLAKANVLRYSLPDHPESFPVPYFLSFNTPKKDVITYVKTVGQVLIVGLLGSIKRVNYLPRETDTEFDQGAAHEDLASDHGIVGPRAGTLFDLPNGGVVLAYVSFNGIHITDGITTRFLNTDLDWATTVDLTHLTTCVLCNDSARNLLILFYAPYGTTHGQNTRALAFSYSPDKLKNGYLPAVGPVTVSGRSACEAILNGVPKVMTGHQTLGTVYLEDSGLVNPASYTVANTAGTQVACSIVPVIRTRLIYPAGVDREVRQERVYLRVSADGTASALSCTTSAGSTTVTSSAAFGSVLPGMYVYGSGLLPGTIVTAVATTSSLTISQAATDSGATSLTFSSGTVSVGTRGQNIREAIADLETTYQTTDAGGLVLFAPDNQRQSFELRVAKVQTAGAVTYDLSTALRLHYFAYQAFDGGPETNRSGS